MMNLMKENKENKKRIVLSGVCGIITLIAVAALVVIVSYMELPQIVRIALIILAAATAVVGIRAAAMLDMKTGYFECPHCKEQFVPSVGEYLIGCHIFTRRRLTCPKCGKKGMCRHRVIRTQ